jgi:hypothetical protein
MQEAMRKVEKHSDALAELEAKSQRPQTYDTERVYKSITDTIVESKEYKETIANQAARGGPITLRGLNTYPEYSQKSQIPGSISGLADLRNLFATLRLPDITFDPLRPTRIRDLFNVVTTKAHVIEWLRQKPTGGFSGGATPVAEGYNKPESSFDFELVQKPMTTIATYTQITWQALNDINMLQDHVTRYLLGQMKEVEDVQLLYGSGLGANIEGLYNVTGIQQHVQTTETRIDALRKAVTKIQNANYMPDGILMHPNDWEKVELAKDNENRYLYGNSPAAGAERVLWRLPVYVSTAVNELNPMVGAFRSDAVTIYDHDSAQLRISDSHGDTFIHNVFTLLLEQRLTMICRRPRAMCEVVFGSGNNYN